MGKTAAAELFEQRRWLNLYLHDREMDRMAGRGYTISNAALERQKQRVELAEVDVLLGIEPESEDPEFDTWLMLQVLEELPS
jgi:hypothetical protein